MKILTSEQDLYTEFLRDIYSAEVLQVSAFRAFNRAATSEELKELLRIQTSETRMQVLRLEELLEDLNESLVEDHCRTMESMIEEAEKLVKRCGDRQLKDMAIIASVQRIKQCEITVYRMLLQMAGKLNFREEADVLEMNLKEDLNFLDSVSALTPEPLVKT